MDAAQIWNRKEDCIVLPYGSLKLQSSFLFSIWPNTFIMNNYIYPSEMKT